MKVLVTGSRDWPHPSAVFHALEELKVGDPDLVVAHGACPTGADDQADWWANRNCTTPPERYPVDWKRDGRAAGPIRNVEMIAESKPDLVLAFIMPCTKSNCPKGPEEHDSHGTFHCARHAEKKGILVQRIRPGDLKTAEEMVMG